MALSVIFALGPLSALAVADETATDTEQTTGSDNDATSNDADDDLQAANEDASDDEEPLEEVSGYVVEISIPNVVSDTDTDVIDDDADSNDNGDDDGTTDDDADDDGASDDDADDDGDDDGDTDDDGATDDDATDDGDDDDATDDDATDDGDDDGDSYITVRAEDGHLFILAVAPNVAIQAETTEDGDYIISIGDFVELELSDGAVTQIAVITEDEDEGEDEDADEGEGDSETRGSAMAAATGIVASVGSTITIATPNGGEYTYNISDSTKVFAGPDNLSVEDIEEGDMVTVKGDGEGGAAWVRFVGKSVLAKRISHPVFGKGIGNNPADDNENGEDEVDDESEIQTESGNRFDKDGRPDPARGKGRRGR